ncbi:hypothetical protein JHK86_004581 [Glycine max]|nr:hypothetical protein JHK86_004581 [Glycine max]
MVHDLAELDASLGIKFTEPQPLLFTTKPYACDPSSLPKYPPTKEMDAKRRDNEARRCLITRANAKSRSEKFLPPHEDGQLVFPLGSSIHIDPDIVPSDVSLGSTSYTFSKEPFRAWLCPIGYTASISVTKRKKHTTGDALDLSKS